MTQQLDPHELLADETPILGPELPPSVIDQQPVDTVPTPMLAGTFAVYELPNGCAGLVIETPNAGVARHFVPKVVVDMVLYGKKPSMGTVMAMFKGEKP
jgi:hypothetical protein